MLRYAPELLMKRWNDRSDIEAVYTLSWKHQDGLSNGTWDYSPPHGMRQQRRVAEKTHLDGDSVDVEQKVVRLRMMYVCDWLQLRVVRRCAWTSIAEAVCLFVRHVASVAGARGHASRLHRVFDKGHHS